MGSIGWGFICAQWTLLSSMFRTSGLHSSPQVSYVLDTEDLMVRRKRRRAHQGEGSSAAAAAKRARFERWLANAGKPPGAAHTAAADGGQAEAGDQALEQLEAAALQSLAGGTMS
jgi:hypothetical protein